MKNKNVSNIFSDLLRKQGALVIFLALFIAAMLFVKNFASLNTVQNLLKQSAIPLIACIGMTFVLMTGGIDLSVGYIVGFTAFASGFMASALKMNPIVCLILALVIGACIGMINGNLVERLHMPAFIVTMGNGYIVFGVAQIASNGSATTNLAEGFLALGRTQLLGLEMYIWISILVVIISAYLLHFSIYGRALSSMGYNRDVARISGINVRWINISVYVICDICAALAGVLMAIRVNHANVTLGGPSFTFTAITGAVLGGAALSGGKGSAAGALIGILTYKTIEVAINMLGVSSYLTQAVLAVTILVAIVFEAVKNRVMQ